MQGFDTTTGRMFTVASGTQVFASLDKTFLYIEADNGHLDEYWPNGTSRDQNLQLPNGWHLTDSSFRPAIRLRSWLMGFWWESCSP